MHEGKRGYYIYSIFAVVAGMGLFAWFAYLLYDLIMKFAFTEITNSTLIQSFITLIVTVFIGVWYSEWLKRNSNKKLELIKTQKEIAIRMIELMGICVLLDESKAKDALSMLVVEMHKAKLFFDDGIVTLLNQFFGNPTSKNLYAQITDKLQKTLR